MKENAQSEVTQPQTNELNQEETVDDPSYPSEFGQDVQDLV